MAKLNFTVDPNAPKPKAFYDLIEPGNYVMKAERCEQVTTSTGYELLRFMMRITRGEYTKRCVFVDLHIGHPESRYSTRAWAELHRLALAVGETGDIDTDRLLNKEFVGHVYVTRPKNGYDPKNSARSFLAATPGTSLDMLRDKQLAEAKQGA